MRKILLIVGALACAVAGEGLVRIASFVSAFGGGDAPFYYAVLLFMAFAAVVFILTTVGKAGRGMKYAMIGGLILSGLVMSAAPALPVNVQVFASIGVALLCAFAIRKAEPVAAAT